MSLSHSQHCIILQSQAETKPKSICLAYSRGEDFYTFNLSGNDSKYNTEVPLVESHENGPHKDGRLYKRLASADDKIYQCSLAVVGTQLYCIGGMKRGGIPRFPNDPSGVRADVYCVDLSNEKLEWKKCTPMIRPRMGHLTFVVKGKIYVFGGGNVGEEYYENYPDVDFLFSYTPFAEMYDPKTNRWEELPQPPFIVTQFQAFGVSMDDTILYVSDRQLVIYDVSYGSWTDSTDHHHHFLDSYHNDSHHPPGNLVYADKFLYWLSYGTGLLCAYSLDKSLLLKSDRPVDFWPCWDWTFLSHLGGNRFCMLYKGDWSRPKLAEFNRIHCLKFGVTLEEFSLKMDIVIESCQSFIIDKHEDISHAVTIDEKVIEGVEDVMPAVHRNQRIIEA